MKYMLIKDDTFLSMTLKKQPFKYVSLKSYRRLKWRCFVCDKTWTESVIIRKKYNFCPKCQERSNNGLCYVPGCCGKAEYNQPQHDWPQYCVGHCVDGMVKVL